MVVDLRKYRRKRRWAKYQKAYGKVSRRIRNWRTNMFRLVVAVFFGAVLLPPIGDWINGYVKETDGCRVWRVVDGDTVKIQCKTGSYSARILAYDTPELKARCPSELYKAIKATYYLRWQLWKARKITAKIDGIDRYHRKLVVLLVDGEGVARRMVEAGLARWYDGGRRAGWCEDPKAGSANG